MTGFKIFRKYNTGAVACDLEYENRVIKLHMQTYYTFFKTAETINCCTSKHPIQYMFAEIKSSVVSKCLFDAFQKKKKKENGFTW